MSELHNHINGIDQDTHLDDINNPSFVNKKELVRLLIQSLNSLGYKKSADFLEKDSGISLQSEQVNQFSQSVIEGDWERVESLLPYLKLKSIEEENNVKFLIYSQKYFEYLEKKKIKEALQCLRSEITPLSRDPKKLQTLTSLIMSPPSILESKIKETTTSRLTLLNEIRKYVSSDIMLPENRLQHLIKQAIQYQITKCLYHNTTDNFVGLFEDHVCQKDQMPLSTRFTLRDKHKDEIWYIQFSHDGQKLASCSRDNVILIWDMSGLYKDPLVEPKVIHTLVGHTKEASYLSWSPDDSMLISASNDGNLKLWNVSLGCCIKTFSKHTDAVTTCAWHPDGKRFISGGNDRNIFLWSIESNGSSSSSSSTINSRSSLTNTLNNINSSNSNSNGNNSNSNGNNGNNNNNNIIITTPIKMWVSARVNDLSIHKDGKQLIVICQEKKIRIYDIDNEKTQEISLPETESLTSMVLSNDSKFILVNTSNQEIHLWDLEKKIIVQKYRGHKQSRFVIRACFGGVDQAFVLSGSEDSMIYIWHRQSGTLLETLSGHSGTVNQVCYSPCDPYLFCSASDDQTIKVWSRSPSNNNFMNNNINDSSSNNHSIKNNNNRHNQG